MIIKRISEDNKQKYEAGAEFQSLIEKELVGLKNQKLISSFDKNVNISHKGFKYGEQYLANFVVKTINGKFIIIRSTKSLKDRKKIYFHDLEGFTKNSEFSDDIVASIILLPNEAAETNDFQKVRSLIDNKECYSPATHLLVIDEFLDFIDSFSSNIKSKYQQYISAADGSINAKKGYENERVIAELMSENLSLLNYKNNKPTNEIFNLIIQEILNKNSTDKADVLSISATDTIPYLNSGGAAKADFYIQVDTVNGSFSETLSIKTTMQNRITCAQFKHAEITRILNCGNTLLSKYFELFQKYGSYKDFESNLPIGMNVQDYEKLLFPYQQIFCEWVLTGEHDSKNLIDPNKQISTFIFIDHQDGSYTCKEMSVYLNRLLASKKKLKYSVPFAWTYPSKQRGEYIQLKVPIVHF